MIIRENSDIFPKQDWPAGFVMETCVFFVVWTEFLNKLDELRLHFKAVSTLNQNENPHDALMTVKTAEEDYGNIWITCILL
jgi:diadenosine tetraphosphatase ApaH/serine/threonine PP2A family protein phosphatase